MTETQLTKEDVKTFEELYVYHIIDIVDTMKEEDKQYLDFVKLQKVMKFYDEVKYNGMYLDPDEFQQHLDVVKKKYENIYLLWIEEVNKTGIGWNDWLFNYCFVKGLK